MTIAKHLKQSPEQIKDCLDCDIAAIRHLLQNKMVDELATDLKRQAAFIQSCLDKARQAAHAFVPPCLEQATKPIKRLEVK